MLMSQLYKLNKWDMQKIPHNYVGQRNDIGNDDHLHTTTNAKLKRSAKLPLPLLAFLPQGNLFLLPLQGTTTDVVCFISVNFFFFLNKVGFI